MYQISVLTTNTHFVCLSVIYFIYFLIIIIHRGAHTNLKINDKPTKHILLLSFLEDAMLKVCVQKCLACRMLFSNVRLPYLSASAPIELCVTAKDVNNKANIHTTILFWKWRWVQLVGKCAAILVDSGRFDPVSA